MNTSITTIDQYIAQFSPDVQKKLQALRACIQQAAPAATEAMRYGLPTFRTSKNLIHFGAYDHHIGVYPAPQAIAEFATELARYQTGKGTLQFPLDEELPLDLVKRITEFRLKQVS